MTVIMEKNDAQGMQCQVPFLKWAGGKRWLTANYSDIFPDDFEVYIEPFLGSGAVFFMLSPSNAILSDANSDLINTYKAIKNNHRLVKHYLAEHQQNHSKNYYYNIRSALPRSTYQKAARFIYLNRTCWNALYRVNKRGEFNVPIGTKTSVLMPTDNFANTSKTLSETKLLNSDFQVVIERSKRDDFIFVDPPYTVKHNLNGFVKYNERIFSWDDQIRLRDALICASDRGAKILMTNANHKSIRDIYRGCFNIEALSRESVIAASAANRNRTTELLIYNY